MPQLRVEIVRALAVNHHVLAKGAPLRGRPHHAGRANEKADCVPKTKEKCDPMELRIHRADFCNLQKLYIQYQDGPEG